MGGRDDVNRPWAAAVAHGQDDIMSHEKKRKRREKKGSGYFQRPVPRSMCAGMTRAATNNRKQKLKGSRS